MLKSLQAYSNYRHLRSKGLGFVAAFRTAQLHYLVEVITIFVAVMAVISVLAVNRVEIKSAVSYIKQKRVEVRQTEAAFTACLNNQPIWVDDILHSCIVTSLQFRKEDFSDWN